MNVQDMLLHNFAGTHSVILGKVHADYYFAFPPAIIRLDQVSPCRTPGSRFSRVIIGLHEPWVLLSLTTIIFQYLNQCRRKSNTSRDEELAVIAMKYINAHVSLWSDSETLGFFWFWKKKHEKEKSPSSLKLSLL